MKLITKPRVELIHRPVIELGGLMRFLKEHDMEWPEFQGRLESNIDLGDLDGEWIVEMCARLCYMSHGKGRSHDEHVRNILEVAHGSTLEHSNFGFFVWGVSRSLTHELVRHRAGAAYCQVSQRYVDESDTDFVVPPAMEQLAKLDPKAWADWKAHMQASADLYTSLVESLSSMYIDLQDKTERRKKARQAARSVLPNATETKIAITLNARALRHVIQMRASAAADVEIRRLAVEMLHVARQAAPLLFYDMEIITLPDGTRAVESKHQKV